MKKGRSLKKGRVLTKEKMLKNLMLKKRGNNGQDLEDEPVNVAQIQAGFKCSLCWPRKV